MKGTVYVPVSDDGRLESIARPDRVSDTDRSFIRRIVDRVSGMLPDKRMAVYLRGSLAYGGFLEGISDLDMVVFSESFSPDERAAVSSAADEFTRMSADRYSLVDISCVEVGCLCRPEWNRLYLNIALTGIEVFNNGFALSYPQPVFSEALARRIAAQTETDCAQTLVNIASEASFEYMGRSRGADFLCVWFARDYLRGLIAFVMQKERVFSLHLETCAYEFCRCFPQYRAITEKIFMAERSPVFDRQALEQLASEALAVYSGLSAAFFKGEDHDG